jgi:two-component sensor histidine kinase
MIHDSKKIALAVDADDSTSKPDVSISLGLIMTELVINALKHAFPTHRIGGRISVKFHTSGPDWTLSVADNGVGMQADSAKPGLGTTLIQAITAQLRAVIEVVDAKPGTAVSIVHIHAVEDGTAKVIPIHQASV